MRRFVAGLAALAGVLALVVLPTAVAGATEERSTQVRGAHVGLDGSHLAYARSGARLSGRGASVARFATWLLPPGAQPSVRQLAAVAVPTAPAPLALDLVRSTRSRAPPA
jgi:hypothetical protein